APPPWAPFGAACGRVSGQLQHTLLACLAPPTVRPPARVMSVHRVCPWAAQGLGLSPAGGATQGAPFAQWRACLEPFPACNACLKRWRTAAHGLLACQKMLQTQGLSPAPRAPCAPLLDTMPSSVLPQALR